MIMINMFQLNTFFNDLRRQIRMLKEMDLILFNKIYINYTGYLNPSFMTNSTEDYGVTVNKLSFNFKRAAMAFINSWVRKQNIMGAVGFLCPKSVLHYRK